MSTITRLAVISCLGITTLTGCGLFESRYMGADQAEVATVPTEGPVPQRLELEQAWSPQIRQLFWFTSQGSRIMPYTWFTWLEQPDNETLFRDSTHMEYLRYLPANSSALNPAGLPIGFALANDAKTDTAWVGMTCAACHTNQLDYQGNKLLIEGAPTLANFVLFYDRLVAALNATQQDDAKFTRFARRVLADEYDEDSAEDLRNQLLELALAATERQQVNALPASYAKDFTSWARLDAFGNIQNAGTAFALHDVSNNNVPAAPVSYPFLWGTHQSDVVQWNASAPNTPIVGPLVRNIGEVVGVFGELEINEAPWWKRLIGIKVTYSSSVDMHGLGELETWVKALRSPQWPEAYFPAINVEKAAQGEKLYQQQCVSCHQVVARSDEGKDYVAAKTPLSEVGTDSATAANAALYSAKTLVLEGVKDMVLLGDRFGAEAPAIEVPVNGVVGVVLKDPITAIKAGLAPEKSSTVNADEKTLEGFMQQHLEAREKLSRLHSAIRDGGFVELNKDDMQVLVYKGRPLNGIWATAPYLHNGSVPSLWDLLQAPANRPGNFWVGSREFDPVNVGYVTSEGLSQFQVFDTDGTEIKGSSNAGHTYGTELSAEDKWALVEYMKTL